MKQIIIFCFSLLIVSTTYARKTDSIWMVRHYNKIEQYITMRDGVRLFTSIYVPKSNSEPHPILLTRTPYSCAPYGADTMYDFWSSFRKAYLQEGYIMVIQDVRGRWMSEGKYENIRPYKANKKATTDVDEATDSYDTIDWLVKNVANNNGKVGIYGISYPGFYSLMAGASNHPALVAISPQAPCIDWYAGDDLHHNGAFFVMDEFDFDTPYGFGFGVPHRAPVSVPPVAVPYPIHDNYKFYLEHEALSDLTRLTGDTIAYWNDIMSHPDYDEWWKERDARIATKNLKPATLWVGGNFDAEDNWGAWNGFMATEKNSPGKQFNKLVMGPWYHGQWENNDGTHLGNVSFGSNTVAWYQQNMEVPFFNYFLKGEGDVSNIAKATVFFTGANQWRSFNEWPPAGRQDQALYLTGEDGLDWNSAKSTVSYSEYTSDPHKPVPYAAEVHFNRTRNYMTDDQRFADRRPDVLSFKTPILNRDITVAGDVNASIQVALSTTDADIVVKLIDVFPDSLSYNNVNISDDADPILKYPMGGYEMLVHGEVMRGRYRNGLEKPQPFVPGKVTTVAFKIGDVAHTFKKGHRIMVQVQSSWFPLVDMNPQKFVNIYKAKKSDFQKSTVRIYHDSHNPSFLILPILNN